MAEEGLPKRIGAYDTSPAVAAVLANWAVRSPTDTVCDPSFGRGVVLQAAAAQLNRLGGSPEAVFGVELDRPRWRTGSTALAQGSNVPLGNLLRDSFFRVSPSDFGPFSSVVGNPPFIRYQRFPEADRAAAFSAARHLDISLSGLSNAWAPFLLHALSFVARDGRIAVVLPAQLLDANYARPVLGALQSRFSQIEVVRFEEERLFPKLSQEVVLLLAEGFGEVCDSFLVRSFRKVAALEGAPAGGLRRGKVFKVNGGTPGKVPFPLLLLEARPRALLRKLARSAHVATLGDIASIDIGYVTGASNFFHLDSRTAQLLQIPNTWRRPVVRYSKDVAGLRFTVRDWKGVGARGATNYLLKQPRPSIVVPGSVVKFLRSAQASDAKRAWQCSRRERWWDVRIGKAPDAFLLYSPKSGSRIIENTAGVHCSNALHRVRLLHGFRGRARDLTAGWLTSLSQLSAEIESRVLGAGLRKLDPSQAERSLVPLVPVPAQRVRDLEELVRGGDHDDARELADKVVLVDGLGMSEEDVASLRSALQSIRRWQPRS